MTAELQLSIAIASNLRTKALLDGTIKPDGIQLIPSVIFPSEVFWRQLKYADFDISEMSLSSYMMVQERGDDRWIAIPVFTTRHFFHTWILVRTDAGIDNPSDLKGKRVGVPDYQQTAALWSRGILKDEFAVDHHDLQYWMERTPSRSLGGAVGFVPPPGIDIQQIPATKSIGSMMLAGELDATLLYIREDTLIDRSRANLEDSPMVRPLFPATEGARYYEKTGIFPINHTVVIRRELVERHPWIVLNLFKAFNRANSHADQLRLAHVAYHVDTGLLSPEEHKALQRPLTEYGVRANLETLQTAARYSHEQGLTARLAAVDELFARSTLDM